MLIRMLVSIIPAVFYAIIILIMKTYRLDKVLTKMKEEIEARKTAVHTKNAAS